MPTTELNREKKTLPNANSQLSRDEQLTDKGEKNKDLHEPNSLISSASQTFEFHTATKPNLSTTHFAGI